MITRIATTAVAAAAFGLAAIAGSATANANSIDDRFLNRVHEAGIAYDSDSAAFNDARIVCKKLASGQTGVQVTGFVLRKTNLTTRQAAVLVVESTYAFCPAFKGQITPNT